MPELRTAIIPDSESLRKLFSWFEEAGVSLLKTRQWNWGWYNIEDLAQDQVIIKIAQGSRIDTYRGLHVGTDEDIQSDYTDITPALFRKAVFDIAQQFKKNRLNHLWESEYSSNFEEPIGYVGVIEQTSEQETDTADVVVLQWTSDQLTCAILHPQAESDMPHLREMILIAEDTGFTVGQSERLAPWLLSFAEKYRDTSDPQNEPAVWSAIRTGASMLRPQTANLLLPLLEPGHSIETSLVTVKMLGRIFEAQPPAEVDEYQNLANEALRIAESLLNRYAITVSQSAAMAQLAIYALAAMASSETQRIVETVQQLGVTWFTQQMLRELRELRTNWLSRPVPVADRPRQLLDRVILTLE